MSRRSIALAVLVLAVCAAQAVLAETARLAVFVQEAEPLDWVLIRNVEGCGPVSGELVVDFTGSAGQVVIDTAAAGPGTQQFAPVGVLIGPVRPMQAEDGAQVLRILIGGLEPGDHALVTLDLDSEHEAERIGRIEATAAEMAGSVAVFVPDGGGDAVSASLADVAAAEMAVPVVCSVPDLS